jgi:hypothetical protein
MLLEIFHAALAFPGLFPSHGSTGKRLRLQIISRVSGNRLFAICSLSLYLMALVRIKLDPRLSIRTAAFFWVCAYSALNDAYLIIMETSWLP